VPFGTGRAMTEMSEKGDSTYFTANFKSFERLKVLLQNVDAFYDVDLQNVDSNTLISDKLTLQFLESVNWVETIQEIKLYTTDTESYRKRFYRWFNIFMVMKFFHFLRDEGVEDKPVNEESIKLFKRWIDKNKDSLNPRQSLLKYRAKKRVQPSDYTLHK
jgi:uncharacterized protein YaaW (UPF0174 family)